MKTMAQFSPAQRIYSEAIELRLMGRFHESCRHLLVGLNMFCPLEVDRIYFLKELSSLVPHLQFENGDMFKDVDIPDSPHLWAKVLSYLTRKDIMDWTAVRYLVLGIRNDGHCPMEGIAADVAMNGIDVGNLLTSLKDLELKAWGQELAVCLLKKGADVKRLARDVRESPAVAAIRSAIRTGENMLFKYVLENSTEARSLIDSKDVDGNTPLHLLVKSGKTDTLSGAALLKLLLNYGASVVTPDAAGKLPIDYVGVETSAHATMLEATDICIKKTIATLKEQGNKFKQNKELPKALAMYREAISLGEAATGCDTSKDRCILHTNCSLVLDSMGRHQEALLSAEMALQNDDSWYKGYWMLGKCQKALGKELEAFDTYYTALKKAQMSQGSSVPVMFLVAFIQVIPSLVHQGHPYISKVEEHLKSIEEHLCQIINGLIKDNTLDALKILVLGPEPDDFYELNSFQQEYLTMKSGLAAKLQAAEVNLKPLLLVEEKWMGALLIVLLKNGAKLSTLTSVPGDNYLHAAVNFCLRTGNPILMEYLMSAEGSDDMKDIQDTEERSLYHVVCERCPTGSSDICLRFCELLIKHNFNPVLLNKNGKTALDLVQPRSNLHASLSRGVQNFVDNLGKRMREEGKTEYNRKNYSNAISKYEHAIEVIKRTTRDNHELAMLYGNSTECYLKMSLPKDALRSSLLGVECDKDWHKAHWRLAKSYKSLERYRKAVAAFIDCYNCLTNSSDETLKQEILTDLLETMTNSSTDAARHALGKLRNLDRNMLAKMTYHFIQKKAGVGEAMFLTTMELKGKITTKYDLRQLCDDSLLSRWPWVENFIELLVKQGSDHKSIRFQPFDTYLHAGMKLLLCTGYKGTFLWLLDCAVHEKCLNMQDGHGNTLLHAATLYRTAKEGRNWLLHMLVNRGSDPWIQNNEGYLPIDFISTSEQGLRRLLGDAMRTGGTEAEPSRGTGGRFGKKGQSQHDCTPCEELFMRATLFSKNKDVESAVLAAVSLLASTGQGKHHNSILEKCLDLIVELLQKPYVREIPSTLKQLKPKQMKSILDKLAHSHKWPLLLICVEMYGEKKLPKKFGKNISVTSLVLSDTSQSVKQKVMTLLQRNGAKLCQETKSEEALQEVLKTEEYDLVLQMIDAGVNPSSLSLQPGDTPLHAALGVVFKTGNFNIMEKCFKLYKDDTRKYSALNPKRTDIDEDTLMHVASRRECNPLSITVVEFLCKHGVPADALNKDKKRPIDYLPDRNDRRAPYLRAVGGTALSKTKIGEEEGIMDEPTKQREERKIYSHPKLNVDNKRKKALPKNNPSMSRLKEKIKVIILDRPDVPNMFYDNTEEKELKTFKALRISEIKTQKGITKPSTELKDQKREQTEEVPKEYADMKSELMDLVKDESFGHLTWEVECTNEVISFLRDTDTSEELKLRALQLAYSLASGKWKMSDLKQINNSPIVQLYGVDVSPDLKLIYEIGIAFSARCSQDPQSRLEGLSHNLIIKDGKVYSEIIRLWAFVDGPDRSVDQMIEDITVSHKRGRKCLLKVNVVSQTAIDNANNRIPRLYTEEDSINRESLPDKMMAEIYPPASANKAEYNVVKFYPFSPSLVTSVLSGSDTDIEFPFRVTDIEQAIIQVKSSAPILLIGRSGTGKTTCCMFRLWTNFICYWEKAKSLGVPFLSRERLYKETTESRNESCEGAERELDHNVAHNRADGPETALLAQASDDKMEESNVSVVTDNFGGGSIETTECQDNAVMDGGLDGGVDDYDMNEAAIEEKVQTDSDDDDTMQYDHLHQLFVTKNPVLCKEVKRNFYQLSNAYTDLEEHVAKELDDLPAKLQEIDDLSFPLFVTSRQLLLLLDASLDPPHFFERKEDGTLSKKVEGWGSEECQVDLSMLCGEPGDGADDEEATEAGYSFMNRDTISEGDRLGNQQKMDQRREVTYEVFAIDIYPKIMKKSAKASKTSYHPSLVWTEIMSFIKGSSEALNQTTGYLNQADYTSIGRKRAPNFSGERDVVYEIFLQYTHFKKQNFMFDESDIIHSIYQRLRGSGENLPCIHQIYVDETQDFTQSELFLMVHLIQDPKNMFLTGDTAQGIMRGVSFRFRDLKSLFHHARANLSPIGNGKPIEVPSDIYQLTHNYRSHAGILSLASSVLDIMVELFPESFDQLQPDQGLFRGPLPVVLESCTKGDLAILLQGSKRKTSHIEFGAHQAILVVNDSAKNSLPEELSGGIILTIYEAKGLEFDDVLLYNFFKDSQASKEWRVVTSIIQTILDKSQHGIQSESLVRIDEDTLSNTASPRPLNFDPVHHKILNSELKHLYTALTRARVNVWIFDEDEEKRSPMFQYFKKRNLVTCITEGDVGKGVFEDIVFAEKSTAENWLKRANEMMSRQLFEAAAKCFKWAGEEDSYNLALAYHQARKATLCKDDRRQRKDDFIIAAEMFLQCEEDRKAAQCLQNAHEFELGGLLYEKTGLLQKAARMYHSCSRVVDESRCLEQAGFFHSAVEVLVQAGLYAQAIDCVNRYAILTQGMTSKGQTVPSILRENKPGKQFTVERLAYKAANYYKDNDQEKMMEALDRLPRVDDKLEFLKNTKYADEAASMMLKEGKTKQAVSHLLSHGQVHSALELAASPDTLGLCHLALARRHMSAESVVVEDMVEELDHAFNQFILAKNKTRAGICKLLKAKALHSKEDAFSALTHFKEAKPSTNEIGIVESLASLIQMNKEATDVSFADLKLFIQGIDCLFSALKIFLKPVTREDSNKVEMYMNFYGIRSKGASSLVINPKEKPMCQILLPDFYESSADDIVEIDKKEACLLLSYHLADVLNDLIGFTSSHLEKQISKHMLCPLFKQGRLCTAETTCASLHSNYTEETAIQTLEVLAYAIYFDGSFHRGMKCFKDIQTLVHRINVPKMPEVFDHCEQLLDLLLSDHQILSLLSGSKKARCLRLLRLQRVKEHVEECIRAQWGSLSSCDEKQLLDRSKNTDWFLRTIYLVPLFKLNLDIAPAFENLERDIATLQPKWLLDKKKRYALLVEINEQSVYVESLGRWIYDISLWLHESQVKAVIEYSKFVSFFCKKATFSMFPRISTYLLWNELFVAVTLLILSRVSSSEIVLPSSIYLTLSLFSETSSKTCQSIEDQIRKSVKKPGHLRILKECLYKFCELLFGKNFNLMDRLFTPQKRAEIEYLQAERCFILALTLLVNTETVVPKEMKQGLKETIGNLVLPDEAPQRFIKALSETKHSKDTRAVATILQELLEAKGNGHLITCKWPYKSQFVKSNVEDIRNILVESLDYHPSCKDDAMPSQQDLEVPVEEESIDTFSTTKEDRDRRLQEQREKEKVEGEEKAARVIQRFFRYVTMKGRLSDDSDEPVRIIERCVAQQLKEFETNDKECGVCGIKLTNKTGLGVKRQESAQSIENTETRLMDAFPKSSPETDAEMINSPVLPSSDSNEPLLDIQQSLPEELVSETEDKLSTSLEKPESLLEIHQSTQEHQEILGHFLTFKQFYKDSFTQDFPSMVLFIVDKKLKDQNVVNEKYSAFEHDVSRVVRELLEVSKLKEEILEKRQWKEVSNLEAIFSTLKEDFTKLKEDLDHVDKENQTKPETFRNVVGRPTPVFGDALPEEDVLEVPTPRSHDRGAEARSENRGKHRKKKPKKRKQRREDTQETNEPARHKKVNDDLRRKAESQFEEERFNVQQ